MGINGIHMRETPLTGYSFWFFCEHWECEWSGRVSRVYTQYGVRERPDRERCMERCVL
jgi:hypothetical protein